MKRIVFIIMALAFLFSAVTGVIAEAGGSLDVTGNKIVLNGKKLEEIEKLVEKNMKDGKIPGLSLVIVQGDENVYKKGFGYADLATKKAVDSETLFELGSNSKAFTGLAILKLEQEGLISLDDPVRKYLPWLKMKYKGGYGTGKIDGYVDIKLSQLLHHTSGIPFKTIGDIPVSKGDDALEKTVRTLIDRRLDFYPGQKFQYATINYDVLGLVIQKVTGVSYEEYIKTGILSPLGLNSTYLFRDEAGLDRIAKGYKIGFLKPREYNAPVYRGNTPAGYIITDTEDLVKWIRIQLGLGIKEDLFKRLIQLSHEPDRTVKPSNSLQNQGATYAAGWNVFQDGGGEMSHGGENPNFSSYIVFRPEEKLGVGVLANINSSYTYAIGQAVMDTLMGKKVNNNVSDASKFFDTVSFVTIAAAAMVILSTLVLMVICIIQIFRKQRKLNGSIKTVVSGFVLFLAFLAGFGYCLYRIPDIMFESLPWSFIKVWAPSSVIISVSLLFAAVLSFGLLYIMTTLFKKENEKSLFVVSLLSAVSGLGNALIIFTISEALARRDTGLSLGLLLFFILGIVVYVYGQRLVRVRLLKITNNIVYEKRVTLINEIQDASFEKIQSMEDGKIHAGLNNDTETVSIFANLLITAATSIVTLLCCFIYLGIINFYGFLLSLLIIIIASGLYFLVGKFANGIYERTRDIQNVFFKFINDLTGGFKELKINRQKRLEFKSDMVGKCEEYRDQKIRAALAFANVFVAGELLFVVVIGAVAFVFPYLFTEMSTDQLRNYIFIFLYMTGPVRSVLNTIPEIINTGVSYKRINSLIKELKSDKEPLTLKEESVGSSVSLKLENVKYSYKAGGEETFTLGPVNCEFKSGEIAFITGGNGSGKSTLGNVLTGLYTPDSGSVYLNGAETNPEQLSQKFSAVFNECYLFEKLYGISHKDKTEEIDSYLKMLRIDGKVEIKNGIFSTTKLSTGQRKRLGLLISYLEDRDVFFFDEWAADQEPAFRDFFYNVLLGKLKEAGKCVIAITHDDRYFNIADKLVVMEMGKIKS